MQRIPFLAFALQTQNKFVLLYVQSNWALNLSTNILT